MLQKLDHAVITTADLSACLAFYRALGFSAVATGASYALFAGDFKINVHVLGQERSPHAAHVTPGSADLCFEISGGLPPFVAELNANGIHTLLGPVGREGAHGPMQSVYLRDPDGNLLELCSYSSHL